MDWETIKSLAEEFTRAVDICSKMLQSLRKDSLSYRELIEEITKSKPEDPRVVQCAAMKEVKDGNIEITVIYLDNNDQPILQSTDGMNDYGFVYTIKTIDSELAELFSQKNMVIFK